MTDYVNPADVEPGRAGTATVRGIKGVRVMRHNWGIFKWASSIGISGFVQHYDEHLTDLVLDPLPGEAHIPVRMDRSVEIEVSGEAPPDSITITLDDLRLIVDDASSDSLYGMASGMRSEGYKELAALIDRIAFKVDALPKPVPPPKPIRVVTDDDGDKWSETAPGSGQFKLSGEPSCEPRKLGQLDKKYGIRTIVEETPDADQ